MRYEIRNRLGTTLGLTPWYSEGMREVRNRQRAHPLGIHLYDRRTGEVHR